MSEKIDKRIELADNLGSVILYDSDSHVSRNGSNLMRLNPDGHVLWKASLPGTDWDDCFMDVAWDGSILKASTWSGHLVTLDMKSGDITESVFTK